MKSIIKKFFKKINELNDLDLSFLSFVLYFIGALIIIIICR